MTFFLIMIGLIFLVVVFWLLFIAKTIPGIGWDAYSIKDVPIDVRIFSFILFVISAVLFCIEKETAAGIISVFSIGLLAFTRKY